MKILDWHFSFLYFLSKRQHTMNLSAKHALIPWAIMLMGFTSIVTQVLLMRELAILFYGNELSLGVMLGVWLFWTSIGSGFLCKIPCKLPRNKLFSLIQLMLAVFLPFILLLVRASKEILDISLGEMIGFIPMLLITLITLSPFCLLSGLLYTVSCQLVHKYETTGFLAIGKVYLWEACGWGIGGITTSFVLLHFITPSGIFMIFSLLNFVSALLVGNLNPFSIRFLRTVWVVLLSSAYGIAGLRFAQPLQKFCDRILWKGYDLIATQNSPYGNIAVTRMEDQFSFFQNGLLVFTTPDRLTAEESVHFPLLEHPQPKKVLLIGGGLGGGIEEVLKHPSLEKIDYVELDPAVVRLAQKTLPEELIRPLTDSRVDIHFMDGRRFVKKTSKTFDVIILNLPNPYTAQINRFYTLEFFREVYKKLDDRGIFSFQITSSENVIGPELSNFLSSLSATLARVFPQWIIIPGETNHFISSRHYGDLTTDPHILIERLKSRNLQILYIREYYIPYQMSNDRQTYLQSRIHASNHLNRDFKPIGYYFDTILWATTFSSPFKKLFLIFSEFKFLHLTLALVLITALLLLIKGSLRDRTRLFPRGILYSVLSVGFTEISLEVILILSFQIFYGYVYQQLALIVAGYMTGLALGGWLAISRKPEQNRTFSHFRILQFVMSITPFLLMGLLWFLHQSNVSFSSPDWIGGFFLLLAGGTGFIGGCQFPLANRLFLRTGTSVEKTAGFLYATDLIGSSAGAILTSGFLIAILGVFSTLAVLAILNVCSLCLLWASREIPSTLIKNPN